MDLIEKLQNIPIYIINFVLILTLAVPLLYPVGLPLRIDPMTQAAYNAIEAIPEGGVVLFDYSMTPSYIGEMGPACKAITHQMFTNNIKVIFVSHSVDGPMFIKSDISPIAERLEKVYGEDYVFLGYFAGIEIGMAALLSDFTNVFQVDSYGVATEDLPLLQTVTNHEQINLVIWTGGSNADCWVRQANTPYGIPLVFISPGGIIAQVTPYYPTQALGIVQSLGGSAEYELLVGRPGTAIAGMDALSISFLWLIILMILCNIGVIRSFLSRGGQN